MLFSYKFFIFSQLFSHHPNKFYYRKFHSQIPNLAKYPSLATTNNNPQPLKFIPTTETTPHTTKTPIQPTAAYSGNQKPQPTTKETKPRKKNSLKARSSGGKIERRDRVARLSGAVLQSMRPVRSSACNRRTGARGSPAKSKAWSELSLENHLKWK